MRMGRAGDGVGHGARRHQRIGERARRGQEHQRRKRCAHGRRAYHLLRLDGLKPGRLRFVIVRGLLTAIAAASLLLAAPTGCDPTPEKIARWKETERGPGKLREAVQKSGLDPSLRAQALTRARRARACRRTRRAI